MKFKKRIIAVTLSIMLLLVGCSNISIPTNANTAFKNFTFCLFQQEVASNTINLHYSLTEPQKYGITETPISLGSFDFNEASTLASVENLDNALHKFSYDLLSEENQLTYDILAHHIENSKKISSDLLLITVFHIHVEKFFQQAFLLVPQCLSVMPVGNFSGLFTGYSTAFGCRCSDCGKPVENCRLPVENLLTVDFLDQLVDLNVEHNAGP